jgi:hypothetical protein
MAHPYLLRTFHTPKQSAFAKQVELSETVFAPLTFLNVST